MSKGNILDPMGQAKAQAELQQELFDLKRKQIEMEKLRTDLEAKQLEEATKTRIVAIKFRNEDRTETLDDVESIQAAGNFVSVYNRVDGQINVVRYPYDLIESINESFKD